MKKTKTIVATALAITTSVSLLFTAFAATEHWNDASKDPKWADWKVQWETIKNDYEQVSLTPGINETQLNFAWYSKQDQGVSVPAVKLSTNKDMSGAMEFKGTQTAISVSATNAAFGYYSNKVTVSGLKENTRYYYQVFKNRSWSEPAEYSTKSFSEYSILYVGDPQIGACAGQVNSDSEDNKALSGELAARNDAFNWNVTLKNAIAANPRVSFMVSAGDQVNYADREYEYAGYLFPEVLDSLPVSTTIGNHDAGSVQYSSHFNNPNTFDMNDSVYAKGHTAAGTDYYYTYGSVLYVVIDTNNYNCATHKAVIEKAIKENPNAKWRVVMFHQDIYGSGKDHSDSDGMVLRTQLTPIFDENKIDIVLQGHDHTYSRTFQLSGDGQTHTAYNNNDYTVKVPTKPTEPTEPKAVPVTDPKYDEYVLAKAKYDADKAAYDAAKAKYDAAKAAYDALAPEFNAVNGTKKVYPEFLKQNNCYVINSGKTDGNKLIDPKGTVYMEANSSTGSKFYELISSQQDYIAERSQTWTPSYSVIQFSETSATITTYDALSNKILDGSAPYTIVKKANSSSLTASVDKAEQVLSDVSSYTEESVTKAKEALSAAKATLSDETATSEKISQSEADLNNALAGLTKKAPVVVEDETTAKNEPTVTNPNPLPNVPQTGVKDALPVAMIAALLSFAGFVFIVGGEIKKKFEKN